MLQVVCWESKFLQRLLYLPLQFAKGLTWLVTSWQINAARLSRCIQAEDICSCAAECLGASRLSGQMWWDPVCAVPMGDASTPSALGWGCHWGTKLRALGAAPAPGFAIQLPLRGFPAAPGEANPFVAGSCRVMCQQSEESIRSGSAPAGASLCVRRHISSVASSLKCMRSVNIEHCCLEWPSRGNLCKYSTEIK